MLPHPVSPDSGRTELFQTEDLVSGHTHTRVTHLVSHLSLCSIALCQWQGLVVSKCDLSADPGEGVLAALPTQRVTVAASSLDSQLSDLQGVEPVRLGPGGGRAGLVRIHLRHTGSQQELKI